MRKTIVIACTMIFLSASAYGQETPKAELFGGYSYLHTDGGGDLHGWNGSIAVNLNKWFGVVADFSGHYDSNTSSFSSSFIPGLPTVSGRIEADTNIHNFLFGPRFSYRKKESVTPFAHALIGFSRAHVEGSFTTTTDSGTVSFDFSENDTAFAAAFGGGLDVKLSDSLALRLVQADYLLTRFGGFTEHNARISTGLVFRFGSK
ncbi:MAG: outer membrane beta-barrel protein [Acidobacteriota bacterium]